jgi:hypothetical protein
LYFIVRTKVRNAALSVIGEFSGEFFRLTVRRRKKFITSRVRKKLGWSCKAYNVIKVGISFKVLIGEVVSDADISERALVALSSPDIVEGVAPMSAPLSLDDPEGASVGYPLSHLPIEPS